MNGNNRVRDNGSVFPMDRGIDKILRRDDGPHVETGTAGDVAPPSSFDKPRLEQLYALPNLDDYLARELAPLVDDPGVLSPNRFNNALRAAIEVLGEDAQHDSRKARILRGALRTFKAQEELNELLEMFRRALLKG
jgi:hypothetical protein